MTSYAVDGSILTSGQDINDLFSKVNYYPDDLSHFFTARQLRLSQAKFSGTFLISWTREHKLELDVKLVGVKIPTINNPKLMEVAFDRLHCFTAQTTAICSNKSLEPQQHPQSVGRQCLGQIQRNVAGNLNEDETY